MVLVVDEILGLEGALLTLRAGVWEDRQDPTVNQQLGNGRIFIGGVGGDGERLNQAVGDLVEQIGERYTIVAPSTNPWASLAAWTE